jgi:hypothetical protein
MLRRHCVVYTRIYIYIYIMCIKFFGLLSEPGGDFPLYSCCSCMTTRVPILPTRQMRHCEISSVKSSSILRIAPTLLQATSICSAIKNIIFRLNIFLTMKLTKVKSPPGSDSSTKILCCWFSGACETIGQVPQCTGRLC